MGEKKTVWVTGASSGLGYYTAKALAEAGWRVIGGARSFENGGEKDGFTCLKLDVTDEQSVDAFCENALKIHPRADALVQCAGVLILGSCEETSAEEFRRVMDTDFIGMTRMNRRVLPLMRAQGGGRIVMYSSINGLLGIPFQSAYTAAKHAVEGYAECLQMEAKPFGIEIMLVEPGDHRGGAQKYRMHAACVSEGSPYKKEYESGIAVIHRDESGGSDPARLGRIVAKELAKKRLPYRKCIASPDQHLAVWLHKLLPARLNAIILRDYYIKK